MEPAPQRGNAVGQAPVLQQPAPAGRPRAQAIKQIAVTPKTNLPVTMRHVPEPQASGEMDQPVQVEGRVVDPDGHPVPRAKVVFHQRTPYNELPDFIPGPVTSTTDATGRFQFTAVVHQNAVGRDRLPMLTLTAYVPGYGPAATAQVSSADKLTACTLHLVKDDVPIRGRILSLEGKPVPGVTIRPVAIVGNIVNDLGQWAKWIQTNTGPTLPSDHQMHIVFSAAAAGLTNTAVTDAEGKFTLSRFGRERLVVLRVEGPTIETQLLHTMTREGPAVVGTRPVRSREDFKVRNVTEVFARGANFDYAVGPSMPVEGSVRDWDTGVPLGEVAVNSTIPYQFGWAQDELRTTTDSAGNYRLSGLPSSGLAPGYNMVFRPAAGQPYLAAKLRPQGLRRANPPGSMSA